MSFNMVLPAFTDPAGGQGAVTQLGRAVCTIHPPSDDDVILKHKH